jgi:hypothetical protein
LRRSCTFENPCSEGVFQSLALLRTHLRFPIAAGVVLIILNYTSLYNILLFHVLIEIFSVILAFAIIMFAWNIRDKSQWNR